MIKYTWYQDLYTKQTHEYTRRVFNIDKRLGKTWIMLRSAYEHGGCNLIVTGPNIIKREFIPQLEQEIKPAGLLPADFNIYPVKEYNIDSPVTYITSYQHITRNIKEYARIKWNVIYCDESHKLSNVSSKITQYFVGHRGYPPKLKCNKMFWFTGTLRPNRWEQVYPMLKMAGAVDYTWSHFLSKFFYNPVPKLIWLRLMRPGVREELMELISTFTTTLVREDCGISFTGKDFNLVEYDLSPSEREIYDAIYETGVWDNLIVDNPATKRKYLRNIVGGYLQHSTRSQFLYTKQQIEEIAPTRAVITKSLIDTLLENQTHIVLFYNFTQELMSLDIPYWLNSKRDDLELWKKNGGCIGIQYQSGKEGLTLKEARTIILYSLPEDFVSYDQAIDRITQRGIENNQYYILLAKNSIDNVLYKALKEKKNINQMLENYCKGNYETPD